MSAIADKVVPATLQKHVSDALQKVIKERPENPVLFVATELHKIVRAERRKKLSEEQIDMLRVQFDAADTDQNGSIDYEEYASARKKHNRRHEALLADAQIRRDFDLVDSDNNNEIDFDEYCLALAYSVAEES